MTAVATAEVRVFLLDDTRELRQRVRAALAEAPGLAVVGEADDPVDGLPMIEGLQPDIVVCDLSMPRMDGLEAIPRIAECAPAAGIVIFSGFLSEALGATALDLGADRYVEKSAPLATLQSAIREVAAARQAGVRPQPSTQPKPAEAPRAPAAVAAAPIEDPALDGIVAEARSIRPRWLWAAALASAASAAGLSLALDLPPSTFLVLWLTPVVGLGALVPRRWALLAAFAVSCTYAYCSYNIGTNVWYGAFIGISTASITLVLVAAALMEWMSRRVAAHEALTRELQRSNAELEHFAYVASHDLAAPLRTVSSFTTMLARRYEGRLDPEADKMIGFITGGAARMQRMIDDLLAFARAGRVDSARAPFELEGTLERVLSDLAAQITDRDAAVTNGELPRLVADEARIAQVLQNLISNAIKFCPPEQAPAVEVTAARLSAGWRIDVRDNGIGVDPRFASKVFGMFQRLHTDEQFPGTGIGLAICQRIVERHGGRIWVDSVQDEGSTFSFTLPDAAP